MDTEFNVPHHSAVVAQSKETFTTEARRRGEKHGFFFNPDN